MRKHIVLLAFLFTIAFSNLHGQIKVTRVNASSDTPGGAGVFYVLPKTVVKVDVTIRVTEQFKGPLSEYAQKYFGIDDAINFDQTFYEIEDVYISSLAEPDPEHIYYIQRAEPSSKEQELLSIQIDKSGFLIGVNNLDSEMLPGSEDEQVEIYEDIDFNSSSRGFVIDGKIKAKIDTIIRKVAVDTAMIEKLFYRTRIVEMTNDQLASVALNKIDEIRDARYKLLTGYQETAYSPGTISYMDGEMIKLESEYMALFRGKTFTGFDHYTFYYTPQNQPEKNGVNLFNFSSSTGITDSGSAAGDKVMLKFNSAGVADILNSFPTPELAEGNEPGIFYRVPETAELSIEWDEEELLRKSIVINQFGKVRSLQGKTFKIQLEAETGGLKSVVVK